MPTSGINKRIRKRRIWVKAGGRCAHCGNKVYGKGQTIDHFIPKSKGGGYDTRNLMPLCVNCNRCRKSELVDPREFYPFASLDAINKCLEYKNERQIQMTNSYGEAYI